MSESIEQLLKQQPLRQPSAALDQRIHAALAAPAAKAPAAPNRWKLMLFPVGLAAAAAVAMAVTINLRQPDVTAPPELAMQGTAQVEAAVEPVIEISQSWTHVEPVDVLLVSDSGGVLRAVRQQQLQHTRWIDPADGVAIEVTKPLSEPQLVLQPAQVY